MGYVNPNRFACNLHNWTALMLKCKQAALNFGVPMVWREQVNNFDDCYFCLCNLAGYNKKNKKDIEYPNLRSAIRPILHGPDVHYLSCVIK